MPHQRSHNNRSAGEVVHEKDASFCYISPLPLPTGAKPEDSAQAFMGYESDTALELGGVYLDLDHWSVWLAIWWGFVMFFMVGLSLFTGAIAHIHKNLTFWEGFWGPTPFTWPVGLIFFSSMAIFLLWIEYKIHYKRRFPNRRIVLFNRDRREVWVEDEDGQSSFIVPWEQVVIWVHSSASLGPHGMLRSGSLMFSFKHPRTGLYLTREIGGGHPHAGLRSVELLRRWMNHDIKSVKDVVPYAREGDPVWPGLHTTRQHYARAKKEAFESPGKFLNLILFYLVAIYTLGFFTHWLTQRYNQKAAAYASQRQLWPDDLWEWSQPIPPEERVQPSEELLRKSAMMEQALAEEQDSDLPPFDRYMKLAWSMRYR